MKKIVMFLLLLAALLLSATACNKPNDNDNDTTVSTAEDTTSTVEDITKPAEHLTIVSGGVTDYVIIRPEKANSAEIPLYTALKKSIDERFGCNIPLRFDRIIESAGYTVGEKEILVGITNREESANALAQLRFDGDYLIKSDGKKIVIIASNVTALSEAIDDFMASVGSEDRGNDLVFREDDMMEKHAESHHSVSFANDELYSYGVVLEEGLGGYFTQTEEKMISAIAKSYGYTLARPSDLSFPSKTHKIYIGNCGDAIDDVKKLTAGSDAAVTVYNGDVYITGKDNYAVCEAMGQFAEFVSDTVSMNEKETKTLSVDYSIGSVMSYNVLGGSRTDERMSALAHVIGEYSPDSFGTQELKGAWLTYLTKYFGDIYDSVGEEAAENGYSEKCYVRIFYNKFKYKLVETGTFWLSDTPSVPGSAFTQSKRVRYATYAVLEEIATGKKVVHFNTHLDNSTDEARLLQLGVLLDKADQFKDLPLIITGDFNSKEGTTVYNTVLASGARGHVSLVDSKKSAADSSNARTYNGLGTSYLILDYVFMSDDKFEISKYTVYNNMYNGVWPSDHNPVYVEFNLK